MFVLPAAVTGLDLVHYHCNVNVVKANGWMMFPDMAGRKSSLGQNTSLKISIFVNISAFLLNWVGKTHGRDGAKLFGQSYVRANCLMSPGLWQR